MLWSAVREYRLRKVTGQCVGNGSFLTRARSPERHGSSSMISGRLERELPGHSGVAGRAVADQLFMSGPLGAGLVAETRHGMSIILSRATLTHNPLASETVRSLGGRLVRLEILKNS